MTFIYYFFFSVYYQTIIEYEKRKKKRNNNIKSQMFLDRSAPQREWTLSNKRSLDAGFNQNICLRLIDFFFFFSFCLFFLSFLNASKQLYNSPFTTVYSSIFACASYLFVWMIRHYRILLCRITSITLLV